MTVPPLLAALVLAGATPDVAPPAPLREPHAGGAVELSASGRVGASAGHVLAVPYAFTLPGGGADLKLRHGIHNALYGHGALSFSLGVDESGTLGGGYRARGGLGLTWLDVGWFAFATEAHLGLGSISLIPVPALGLRAAAVVRPVRFEHFVWELGADLEPELLVVVPRLKGGVHTAVTVPIGWFFLGVAAEASAEAVVAVVANLVSATAGARLFVGFAY